MDTIIVTDGKYRSSIAAVRALGRAGYRVIITQTREDVKNAPPVFSSAYAGECRWIEGACADETYGDKLLEICREYERPVLFCVGAASLNTVSKRLDEFGEVCDVLVSPPEVLDALNDKEQVHGRAQKLGLPVPREYSGEPDKWPVVVKPHCGEKHGLKAQERYIIADSPEKYRAALAKLAPYDPVPIVQEKVYGEGFGASLLLDRDSRLVCAVCHRRVREYPIAGGPSACCESLYDPERVEGACQLLKSFGFAGAAMVEFKGDKILEVNPRVWGSFPMTEQAGSPFAVLYARAARGEWLEYVPENYKAGVRMRFMLNDTLATLSLLKAGRVKDALAGAADVFRAKEALNAKDDKKPLREYLKQTLRNR